MSYRKKDPTSINVNPVGSGHKEKTGPARVAPSRHEKNHVGKQHVTGPIQKGRLGGKKF